MTEPKDPLTRALDDERDNIKDRALRAGQAAADLQTLLLDACISPDKLEDPLERALLSKRFLELTAAYNQLQAHAAALALVSVVRGQPGV